jgi:hypothetical protein
MLSGVVARDLAPGANVPDVSGDVWGLLLPTLEPAHALCVGDVPADVLATLRRGAGELTVAAPGELDAEPSGAALDLVVVDAAGLRGLADRRGAVPALRRRLAPEATVVVHGPGATRRRARRIAAALAGQPLDGRPPAVLAASGRPARREAPPGALAVPGARTRAQLPRTVRRLGTLARLVRTRTELALRRDRTPDAARAHPSDLAPRRPVVGVRLPGQATLMLRRRGDLLGPPAWLV